MKKVIQLFSALFTVLFCLGGLAQSVPSLINYQGQLLDSGGSPLTNGDYVIQVSLFTAESGGGAIWGPQIFNGQSGTGLAPKVPVVQGRFNLVLGPQDTSARDLASVFSGNPTVYLELKVGTGSPISPRQQVLAAPFSLSSAYAVNAQNAANAQNAVSAQNAVNAQSATTAQLAVSASTANSATSAQNAANAANAANSAKLSGYDWGAIFSGSDPSNGTLNVAAATVRGDLSVNGRLLNDMQIGTGSGDYRHLRMGGGNSDGFLYGSWPLLGDGIHLGYNFYGDASGNPVVIHPDGGTSRITASYGSISLATGGAFAGAPSDKLVVGTAGVIVNGSLTINGSCNGCSDRNVKQDFAPVSPSQILEAVVQLPLSKWSYKTEPTVRHIGPMAQDFYAGFKIGTDEKHIASIDEAGVALAAIQALNQKLEQRETQIRQLEQRLEKLEQLQSGQSASTR